MSSRIAQLGLYVLIPVVAVACSQESPTAAGRPDGDGAPVAARQDQVAAPDAKGQRTGARKGTLAPVVDPVEGVVIGPEGRARPGARVTLFRRLRQWPRRDRVELDSVRCGQGGRFVFGVSRAPDLEVEVRAQGCATMIRPAPKLGSLVMRLRPGFALRGQVLLPNDRPARNCAVFLEPGSGSQMRAMQTRTDDDGRYLFEHVPAENLRVSARHEHYRPATSDTVTIGRPASLKFEQPGLVLSGTVRSADDGDAVAGAEVLVYPRTNNGVFYVPFEATTDTGGAFTVRGLGAGSYNVEVRHDRYSSSQRSASIDRSRVGFDVGLQTRTKVRGRLRGAKDLDGVRLSVVSFFGEMAATDVQTDGSFEFPGGLSRGMATLELCVGPYSFKSSQSRWLRQALVEADHQLDLEVESASIVTGKVEGQDGKPLPGVEVIAALKVLEDPWNLFSDPSLLASRKRVLAVTDEDGNYTIRGLGPGEVNLGFQKEQYFYFQKTATVHRALAKDARPESVVQLNRPATLEGRVTRGGRPVSGALVTVGQGLRPVFTGPQGRYELHGLPPGEHLVRVKYRTLPVAHPASAIKLDAGQRVTGVDIELPVGRRLRGRVVDAEELPMADVLVESSAGTSTRSDESGKFVLDVPLGRTALFVRMARFDPSFDRVAVGPGETEVLVRMRQAPRASLKAKVLTLPRELPVVGLILRLDDDSNGLRLAAVTPESQFMQTVRAVQRLQRLNEYHERGFVERWIETPDGVLQLHNLPPGTFTLTLHCQGFQPFKKEVHLANGKTLDLGVVKLERGFKVHGLVLNRAGKPVPGARVVLGRESDLTLAGARTHYLADRSGRFTVEGVGLELRTLFVTAKGYANQSRRLDLSEDILRGQDDPVTVILQPGATIKVQLVDHEGEAVPFRTVQLNRWFQRIGEAETDENGVAWFNNLSTGSYHVYLEGRVKTLRNQVVKDTSGARVYEVRMKVPRTRRSR